MKYIITAVFLSSFIILLFNSGERYNQQGIDSACWLLGFGLLLTGGYLAYTLGKLKK